MIINPPNVAISPPGDRCLLFLHPSPATAQLFALRATNVSVPESHDFNFNVKNRWKMMEMWISPTRPGFCEAQYTHQWLQFKV
jgi:hypothetical protein